MGKKVKYPIKSIKNIRKRLHSYCHKRGCKQEPYECPRSCCIDNLNLKTAIAWQIAITMDEFIDEYGTAQTMANIGSAHASQVQNAIDILEFLQDRYLFAIGALREHDSGGRLYKILISTQSRFYGDRVRLNALLNKVSKKETIDYEKEVDDAYEAGVKDATTEIRQKLDTMVL